MPMLLGGQLAGLDLGAVLPERRRLDHRQVADDEPLEVGQAEALHLPVGRADGGVLADDEVAGAAPLDLVDDRVVGAVVAGEAGQVVEAELVLRGGGVTPPGLEQADRVGVHVAPEAGRAGVLGDELLERAVLRRVRHRDVPREDVEQGRDVGGPLDARVPAQGEDAAAGPADVAEQGLQDRGRPDDLHAGRVVGPADGVAERARALAAGVLGEGLRHAQEVLLRHAAHLGDELRCVAGEVALEDLEHAARVLEGLVALGLGLHGRAARTGLLGAGRLVLLRLLGGGGPGRAGRGRASRRPGTAGRSRTASSWGRTGPSRGRSRRTARRGPRCRGSPRRRWPRRSCSARRTRGSRGRSRARGARARRGRRCRCRPAAARGGRRRPRCG